MSPSNKPYDPKLDTIIYENRHPETGLCISVHKYGSSEPKIKLGPRIVGDDSKPVYLKLGRISINEFLWISEVLKPYVKS
ncbi:hypothetical protein EVB32_306 [Rhizobium phage RHph_TM39]|uniref:Uncharacterized protein n=2 Tax=Cuauhnahuacvirus TaxID=3044696 RepID=A0A7S5UYZ7_9CAUD|nr:hypothetical protein PQC16_gp335 [Rhizobium phage RHph_TM30]YP_010671454.1 hypothetical protein PQC17_gp336 [Rhizobium phage RHph_Y65]QIG71777.1 hypothetical protein EVB94_326 [Rhizobium phage RHph_TM40]QIG72138.1 hypothetical protein EVB95_324 [Rhizobium phage RHph_TM2_3B]QIG72500.1 hypothetical protein EVB96_324 [Rhizobium phage RHph_TM3_3_6]QIG77274.1 hypothetical protein EVB32_306 [Rhizobium phage RHph_TM39]QIG77562.1 hypothetical protein EVB61_256 [Rhizobium phage RHph_TM21B]QIG77890